MPPPAELEAPEAPGPPLSMGELIEAVHVRWPLPPEASLADLVTLGTSLRALEPLILADLFVRVLWAASPDDP